MATILSLLRHPAVLLLAAALLGSASFWGAARYLERRAASAEHSVLAGYAPQAVIVARSDLPASTRLTREQLAVRRIPAKFIAKGVATPDELQRIEGRHLLHAVSAGNPIAPAMLTEEIAPVFSASIPAGARALTFPVDEVNSFSGLLAPGDLIDLLYSIEATPGGERVASVRPLLQAVRVRATGRTTRRLTIRKADGSEAGIDREFTTITLDLSPEDAQRVVLAQQTGELTAVLRNPDDAQQRSVAALDSRSLLPATAPRATRTAPRVPVREVEIILGGRGPFVERPEG